MTATESETSVSLDAVLSAVANERRRAILRSLDHADGAEMEIGTLVDRVAERLRDRDRNPESEHRHRIHISLHHVHLPKLEDCELVVYDTERGLVHSVTDELTQKLLAVIEARESRR